MTNINQEVWRLIDNDVPLKRNLLEGLINISALTRKLIKEHNLVCSPDAVISAIRRYQGTPSTKADFSKVYDLMRKAKLSTKTKLASVLLKKSDSSRKKLSNLMHRMDTSLGDTMRIFEVTKYIKVIIDEKALPDVREVFSRTDIVGIEKGLGELGIIYNMDITKVPGLFATLSNELASQNISVVDSMICHSEHIVVVAEDDIERAFSVIFGLIKKK